jgi:hypothetical protein
MTFKPPLGVLLLDMDKSKRLYVLKIQTNKYEIKIGNFTTCTCMNFVTNFKLIGKIGKMEAMKTHVICIATCNLLWAIKKFHSFLNLEL